tara:strand:+ start:181 stop:405 length:225 start_codon:yes stop_codon:yes gene_type:complete
LSATKAKRLYEGLQRIRQQKRQAQLDFQRGKAEVRVGEPQGTKLMNKSVEKYNRLSADEKRILEQLEGYQPDLF